METPQASPQTPAGSDTAFHTLPVWALPVSAPLLGRLHTPVDLPPGEDAIKQEEEGQCEKVFQTVKWCHH